MHIYNTQDNTNKTRAAAAAYCVHSIWVGMAAAAAALPFNIESTQPSRVHENETATSRIAPVVCAQLTEGERERER